MTPRPPRGSWGAAFSTMASTRWKPFVGRAGADVVTMAVTKSVRPAPLVNVNYVGLMSAVIVVEERLRTTGMTVVLSFVAVIVAGADILVASRSSGARSLS